jgi:hypothetical protein
VDLSIIKATDLSITFKGAECSNIQIANANSPYSVTCNLEQLNGQNIEEAGDNLVP